MRGVVYPYKQLNENDCGPTCLKIICRYHDVFVSIDKLRTIISTGNEGTSIFNLSIAAESLGFRAFSSKVSFKVLIENLSLPCIVHWNQNHFVVAYKASRKFIFVIDPASGMRKYTYQEFIDMWVIKSDNEERGVVLFLEATPGLFSEKSEKIKSISFSHFFNYFKSYKSQIFKVLLGMIASMLLTFILPFITKSIVDIGINGRNIGFLNIMLLGQFVISFSSTLISFIQSWIFLHVGTRIGLSISIEYIAKVLSLRFSYLESKTVGDFMQRMTDNERIQSFISSTTLSSIFSMLNVIVFGVIIAIYNSKILFIFAIGNIVYTVWVLLFIKKRKEYDNLNFEQYTKNQNSIIQIFNGLSDIKLYNFEDQKRWEWERIRAKLYSISVKQLALGQQQGVGAFIINQTTNILITYNVALLVINGEITYGTMLSMQFILGQMGAPLLQLINIVNTYQDAKLSLERISEIHIQPSESDASMGLSLTTFFVKDSIIMSNIYFKYNESMDSYLFNDLNLTIPCGKFTAIVGSSGCGKTTLLKLLLKLYSYNKGSVLIGEHELSNISTKAWRDCTGAVLQDSYLFSSSIIDNIILNQEDRSYEKVIQVAKLVNIHDFITSLPYGYDTQVGDNGLSVSQGQKQRILLARILYKQPDYLLLDEATNALDFENERLIVNNILNFMTGKTVIFVSHRINVIKEADTIIVMSNGEIVEKGRHLDLLNNRGEYFHLAKNQLTI